MFWLGAVILINGGNSVMASPGTVSQERVEATGQVYTLSVPSDHNPEQPAPRPLVISLHYGGPVTPYYGRGLLEGVVEPALRPLGAIMIAPDCPGPAWAQPPCEQAVFDLIEYVQTKFAIDPKRIVLTGYSKGGIGTWALAARHPDRFSAAIVMAGQPPKDLDTNNWQLPLYVIHGERDELLHLPPVVAAVHLLKQAGAPVEIDVRKGITHFETDRFGEPLAATLPWLKQVLGM
jgi:predicted peptidase